MKRFFSLAFGLSICLLLAALLALPGLASSKDDNQPATLSEDAILRGVDLWVTPADGRTYSDFSEEPIPADFFCEGSAPFSGRIAFKGGGLNPVPAGAIGGADTIIERMDDAIFNAQGVAETRLRFLALSLTSIEPLQNECGQFQASIRLEGEQPLTSMRIVRQDASGGTYSSQLSVNARLTFTPLGRENAQPLSISQQVRFAPNQGAPWMRDAGHTARPAENYARVDVDGDGQAETVIPGPSNFVPGLAAGPKGALLIAESQLLAEPTCHCDPTLSFEETTLSSSTTTSQLACQHLHCPSSPGVLQPAEQTAEQIND